jgi:hypothetical protein
MRPEGDTFSGAGHMSLNVTHGHRKEEALFRQDKSISVTSAPAVVFHSVADIRRHSEWDAQAWDGTRGLGKPHEPAPPRRG